MTTKLDKPVTLVFRVFTIRTDKPETFIDALDALCMKYAYDDDFLFRFEEEA